MLGLELRRRRADVVGLEVVIVDAPLRLVATPPRDQALDALDDDAEESERSEERETHHEHDPDPLQDFHRRTVAPRPRRVKGANSTSARGGSGVSEQADDLSVFGEAAAILLGVDQLAARAHVELRPCARRRRRVDPELLHDLGRETRGPCVVPASGGAEEDLDVHGETLVRSS